MNNIQPPPNLQLAKTEAQVLPTGIPANVYAAARTLAGLSQGGLASLSGKTRGTIVRLEQGLPIHDNNRLAILNALLRRGVRIERHGNGEVILRLHDHEK